MCAKWMAGGVCERTFVKDFLDICLSSLNEEGGYDGNGAFISRSKYGELCMVVNIAFIIKQTVSGLLEFRVLFHRFYISMCNGYCSGIGVRRTDIVIAISVVSKFMLLAEYVRYSEILLVSNPIDFFYGNI